METDRDMFSYVLGLVALVIIIFSVQSCEIKAKCLHSVKSLECLK